jgi:L-lactate dehydrogenase complex protein LldG
LSAARDQILGSIRRSLKRGALPENTTAALAARLAAPPRNLVPARATSLDHRGQVALFTEMALEVQTTVARVAAAADVPGAVADYLAGLNLPAQLVVTPDPALDDIPWGERPLLAIRRGRAEPGDAVGIAAAFAGIAETGTLMLLSGPQSPTRNNFLPDTHIVVLRHGQIVPSYEEAWRLLRERRRAQTDAAPDAPALPRTVNLITGPSRTGDIEQRIEIGAHGPRRLHIVLIAAAGDASPQGDGGAGT